MKTDTYSGRIDRLFYSRSNEKEQVCQILTSLVGKSKFKHALDIGPGPGLITAPLARATKKLMLIEIDKNYELVLKGKFPKAEVLIKAVEAVALPPAHFDFILSSQNLYYHPEQNWKPLLQTWLNSLTPKGRLAVLLNRDEGDWWQIVSRFWDSIRPAICFHYQPLNRLRKEVETFCHLGQEIFYSFWVEFNEKEELVDFIGHQALQIYDEAVFEAQKRGFQKLADEFIEKYGRPAIEVEASVMVLQPDQRFQ